MCNDSKRVKNVHGSTLDSNTQANQGQGGQGNSSQGYQNQGKGVKFQKNNSNPGRGKGYQGGKYNPPQNQGEILMSDDFPLDFHVEVLDDSISHVPISEEFLHIPSNLPSTHLNVTVTVQNNDKTGRAKELRAVGKAVLDTANFVEDFI